MIFWLQVGFFILLLIFVFSPLFLGVPFLPTHRVQAKKMIELAEITPGMKVVDLGSGAGRLLFLAANSGANAIGYELNPFLVIWTKLIIFLQNKKNVQVYYRSIYDANIAEADVIFMFLYPPHMAKLQAKIFTEAKPGAKILSYVFHFTDRPYLAKEQGIYIYKK